MQFVRLMVRTAFVVHGYDADNHEVIEQVDETEYVEKLVRTDRIQSVSERYVLVTSSQGRMAYWEYDEELASLRTRLEGAGLLL
jgi:hypothetical protein